MVSNLNNSNDDSYYEKLPECFIVEFIEQKNVTGRKYVRTFINGVQIGDEISDNNRQEDFYRFHDVFHFTFATFLGWSPCTRALLKRKRKSNPDLDEYEDGARAAITEEAISLMLFSEAKETNLFQDKGVSSSLLKIIKKMTLPFEVGHKSEADWENAIKVGYSLFEKLILNQGGKIKFDSISKSAICLTGR